MTNPPKPKNLPKNPREVLERNLARARGRLGKTSTMINGRQFAVAVDGTVITFECKRARHRYKINFASKRRRLTATAVAGCLQVPGVVVERGEGRLYWRLSPVREG